jgi:ABC-type polysaccharide/polyol phosphate transport system ATPase subunit
MSEDDDSVLIVHNVSKTFKLPHEHHSGLKQMIVSKIGGKHQRGYEMQHVLKDVSFEVKKGEFFGIVGRNGSGKSTLLKLMSGIYTPDKGSVKVHGSLTPFIELGVGFNPELSGRENLFLNGALMGFSRKEMEAKYDQIVEFAELSDFMDQKLKNYSSGMQVRLAFSIAIQSHSDILILDEVLAVGDEAFQRKCNTFFDEIKRDKSKTIVLVTHSMDAVRKYCTRAILIENGEIKAEGDPDEVSEAYSEQFIDTSKSARTDEVKNKDGQIRRGTGEVQFENIKHTIKKEKFILEFDLRNTTDRSINTITMGIDFCVNTEIIYGNDTRYMDEYRHGITLDQKSVKHFTFTFENVFGNNPFTINMNVTTEMGTNVADFIKPAVKFDSINVKQNPVFKVLAFPKIEIR